MILRDFRLPLGVKKVAKVYFLKKELAFVK